MQNKYLQTITDIYDDFHLTINPQLEQEVRGVALLKNFGKLLFEGYKEGVDYTKKDEEEAPAAASGPVQEDEDWA